MLYAAEIGDDTTSLILAIKLVPPTARLLFRSRAHLTLAFDACHPAVSLSTCLKCSDAVLSPDASMPGIGDQFDACGKWLVNYSTKILSSVNIPHAISRLAVPMLGKRKLNDESFLYSAGLTNPFASCIYNPLECKPTVVVQQYCVNLGQLWCTCTECLCPCTGVSRSFSLSLPTWARQGKEIFHFFLGATKYKISTDWVKCMIARSMLNV